MSSGNDENRPDGLVPDLEDKVYEERREARSGDEDEKGEKLLEGTEGDADAAVPDGFQLTEPDQAENVAQGLDDVAVKLSQAPKFLDAGLATNQSFGRIPSVSEESASLLKKAGVSLSESLQTAEAFVSGVSDALYSAVRKYNQDDDESAREVTSQGEGLDE